jgi:hypothetical protein
MQHSRVAHDGTFTDSLDELERIIHKLARRSHLPLTVRPAPDRSTVEVYIKDVLMGSALRQHGGRVSAFFPDGTETGAELHDASHRTVEQTVMELISGIVTRLMAGVSLGDPTR